MSLLSFDPASCLLGLLATETKHVSRARPPSPPLRPMPLPPRPDTPFFCVAPRGPRGPPLSRPAAGACPRALVCSLSVDPYGTPPRPPGRCGLWTAAAGAPWAAEFSRLGNEPYLGLALKVVKTSSNLPAPYSLPPLGRGRLVVAPPRHVPTNLDRSVLAVLHSNNLLSHWPCAMLAASAGSPGALDLQFAGHWPYRCSTAGPGWKIPGSANFFGPKRHPRLPLVPRRPAPTAAADPASWPQARTSVISGLGCNCMVRRKCHHLDSQSTRRAEFDVHQDASRSGSNSTPS